MTFDERNKLRDLIGAFERAYASCPACRRAGPDAVPCPDCWVLFERANAYEEKYCKFAMNDSQIVAGFLQATGQLLDEDELATFKAFMLEFECEDSPTVAEAIKLVVISLQMHGIEGWEGGRGH